MKILKSKKIIDFEKFSNYDDSTIVYDSPKITGDAMLAFEDGIDTFEDFKEAFMNKKNGVNLNINVPGENNMFAIATDNAKIHATQNNSFDIVELDALLQKAFNSLPQNISNEIKNEVKECLDFIKAEMQREKPQKSVIKSLISGLKTKVPAVANFFASLAEIAGYLNL